MEDRTMTHSRLAVCLLLTLALVAAAYCNADAGLDAPTRDALRNSGKVGDEVIAALESNDSARVIVSYSLASSIVTPKDASFDSRAREAWDNAVSLERNRLLGTLDATDLALSRQFGSARAFAGALSAKGALKLLADSATARIDIDATVRATLAESVPFIGLNAVHGVGFTGQGVTVAVVDTGIDEFHPDLSDNLVGEQCFCSFDGDGCCPDGSSEQSGFGSAYDSGETRPDFFGFSHGTYTSSIVSSRGVIAPPGTAPDADIVSVKVLRSSNGSGAESGVLAALDWVLHNRPDVRIVSMSLGVLDFTLNGPCDNTSASGQALADLINNLRFVGTAVFAASGNDASIYYMDRPGCVSGAISVGASYDNDQAVRDYDKCFFPSPGADQMWCFSNATPRTDLVAPGVLITASDRESFAIRTASGTSAATPMAAGCAAALLQAVPTLTVPQLELALKNAPRIVDERSFDLYPNGNDIPRLDCVDALEQVLGSQGLCPSTARSNCRKGAYPHVGSIYLRKNTANAAKDSFKWYWLHGQQTNPSDFGSPTSNTSFSVCAYDQGGSRLVMNLFAPAGGTCASKPCWTPYGPGGFRYKDKLMSPSGISYLTVTPGSPGYASVKVKGSGANLRAPVPPLEPPLRMQLISHQNNLCFETTFSTPYSNGGTSTYRYFKDSGD
jgi:subtilisin family serine protease